MHDSALFHFRGQRPCACPPSDIPARPPRAVLTGGPGGGKTAVLEVVRRHFCRHVVVLPEAASMLFSGGFPRASHLAARQAAQRAIFHVQDEIERLAVAEDDATLVLCDRGVVDGSAYWPEESSTSLFDEVHETRDEALARYVAVIHLRTPDARAYTHSNPMRVESAVEAGVIDQRIAAAWAGHPKRVFVEPEADFVAKLRASLGAIGELLPPACRNHGWHG